MLFGVNLLPQEDRFYDLIGEVGELAYQSVYLLAELIAEEDQEKAYKLGRDIEVGKARSKEVVTELSGALCKTFITPLDREDIHALHYGLYKIPKTVEKIQERILAFHLKPFQNDFFKLTEHMKEAAEPLQYLIKNLKDFKNTQVVHDKCALIQQVESNTDELLSNLMVVLFEQESDVKQVILRKDIYDLMEKVVDRHRDVGNVLLEVALKNA